MYRITTAESDPRKSIIKAEGAVRGDAARALHVGCQLEMGSGRHVALDMSGVTFIDPPSAYIVRGLARQGVDIRGCSPFISALLGLDTQSKSPNQTEETDA